MMSHAVTLFLQLICSNKSFSEKKKHFKKQDFHNTKTSTDSVVTYFYVKKYFHIFESDGDVFIL